MSNNTDVCVYQKSQIVILSVVDIVTLLMGEPVIVKLLWITCTSKKTTDILNINLALFHNVQYLISIFHLMFVVLEKGIHTQISRFLLVYVQVGGPMGLSFICLERYVAVSHPTSYPLLKTYRFRELCAGTVWLLSVPLAALTVLAPDSSFSLKEPMATIVPLCVMMTMAAMMFWCSSRIAKVLKKCGPGRDELHPVKRRALKTVRATAIITMFCYFPVTSIQCAAYRLDDLDECMITSTYIFLLSIASVVHPVLYLSTQGELFDYLKVLSWPCTALTAQQPSAK